MTANDRLNRCGIVAIDVGGTKICGAVVHMYDDPARTPVVSRRTEVPTGADEGGSAVLARVTGLARELMASSLGPMLGITVGTAGVVSRSGTVVSATQVMPGWEGVPLSAALREATGLPVSVMGDVHAHALGEYRWGAGRGQRSMLLVAVGTGIGAAMVLDGVALRGAHGFGGHLGHVFHPSAQGLPCTCGGCSHVESVASGSGIERQYARLTGSVTSGKVVSERAANADPAAVEVLRVAGCSLGNVLGDAVNVLDPDCVVLSGSVCHAGGIWLDSVREGYGQRVMGALSGIGIASGLLGGDAPLLGAAAELESLIG